jgi:hypothetical protein
MPDLNESIHDFILCEVPALSLAHTDAAEQVAICCSTRAGMRRKTGTAGVEHCLHVLRGPLQAILSVDNGFTMLQVVAIMLHVLLLVSFGAEHTTL